MRPVWNQKVSMELQYTFFGVVFFSLEKKRKKEQIYGLEIKAIDSQACSPSRRLKKSKCLSWDLIFQLLEKYLVTAPGR